VKSPGPAVILFDRGSEHFRGVFEHYEDHLDGWRAVAVTPIIEIKPTTWCIDWRLACNVAAVDEHRGRAIAGQLIRTRGGLSVPLNPNRRQAVRFERAAEVIARGRELGRSGSRIGSTSIGNRGESFSGQE
jgi:hypothetical protein